MTLPKDPQKREEYLQKQREATRARMANPEFKAFNNQRKIEAMQKPEVIAKMQKAQQWRRDNPDNAEKYEADKEARKQAIQKPVTRKKMSEAKKAHLSDPDNLKSMRLRVKESMNRPEVQQKCSDARRVSWQNPEVEANYKKAFQARWERPEEHQKTSETTKAAMAKITNTDKFRTALAAGMSKVHKRHGRTDIENIIDALLQTLEVEFEAQKHIGHWVADFYIPSHNLVVECDGDYWHSREGAKDRDMRKDKYLTEKGYKVIRILGSKIHAKEFGLLLDALEMEV